MSAENDVLDTGADERIADDGQSADDSGPPAPRALGFILDEKPAKVAKHVIKLRTDQNAQRSRNRAVWTVNRWWREGRRFVRVDKRENQSVWKAWSPPGSASAGQVPNKTDRLCRRITNTILVDKPYPDCEPGDVGNEAIDAAQFATQYLVVQSAPNALNLNRVLRSAADKAMTNGSTFGWVTMDKNAGGHRPRAMLAHPEAQHKDDALTDPLTGMPAPQEQLVERYQRPDGSLTDTAREADLQWLPAPKIRLLTGLQVDLLPATSRSLKEAVGVLIMDTTTLGDLQQQFPDEISALTKEELTTLCSYRPDHLEDLLPPYTQAPEDQRDANDKDGWLPAQMVVVTTVYYRRCAEYPYGCYAVIGGETLALHRQKWTAMMQTDDDAEAEEECLRIPLEQCRCLDDDVADNAMGHGMAEFLGPADEVSATALGYEMEHMFRAANPIPFLPIGSIVQPKQFLLRDGTPVFTNPQGKPEWENVPALSATVPALRAEMQTEMNDESGLQQAAQGVEAPSVKSGVHAQTIVQEALKALMNMRDNLGDFYTGLCEIILEQTRAFAAAEDLLTYVGRDGAFKEKNWSRVDFRNTRRVSIAKGSFTMHTLMAKQELATNALAQKAISVDDYNDLVSEGISPILGTQQNPMLLRVRRQLDAYNEGPPPGWLEQAVAIEQQNQQAQLMAQQAAGQAQELVAQGIPVPPPAAPAPPMPPPPHPFSKRLPIDLETDAAKIRHRQIKMAMASDKFNDWPPQWQQLLLAEYAEMANAAGVMTVPAVQQAKAAEAAMTPPPLPKGVTIAMKGDASTVGAEEQAALAGMKGGGAPPPSGGGMPWDGPAAGPAGGKKTVVHIHS